MCGIFGFAKKHNSQSDKQLETIRNVLTSLTDKSSVRGKDSTGFAVMTPDTRNTYKTLADSSSLVKSNDWTGFIDNINRDTTVVIGHVRLATHGTINIRNTHPFTIGEVIGAHNGVIYNYNKMAKEMGKQVEVDSEVIFASLNRNEMKDAFEDIDGDFAVTWIKDSNKIIHLARESGRPMCVAYWKKAKTLFWASTISIMKKALKEAGLKILVNEVVRDRIFTFDTDQFGLTPNCTDVYFHSVSQYSYYYNTREYGANSTGTTAYNNSYNTKQLEYCVVCGKEEYKDELCWSHFKEESGYSDIIYSKTEDGTLLIECGYCGGEEIEKELTWTNEHCYVCKKCLDADEVVKCNWCDEYVDNSDITTSSGFDVCIDCKPHADQILIPGETDEKSTTLRLTESCSV
jgi:predicted glutamine amidotransferase/predicted nucleic acid-binding Zn ribbon protein